MTKTIGNRRSVRFVLKRSATLLVVLWAATLGRDALSQGGDEDAELSELMVTLDEATEIATSSRLNADYLPGSVTVLDGEELESLGAATVWEALSLVPGLQISRSNLGEPLVIARGAGYTLHSGNLKVMLDSVQMNNDLNGQAYPVMSIPVEQVERIEVFLGPGAALYGEYAFAGVINVVTRRDKQRAYARADSQETYGGGVMAHGGDPEKGFSVHINASGWDSAGDGTDSGPDAFYRQGRGYSPGPVDDTEGNRFALIGIDLYGFRIAGSLVRRTMGEYFGLSALPPPGGMGQGRVEDRTLTLGRDWAIASDLVLDARLTWQEHDELAPKHLVMPAGPRAGDRDAFSQRFGSTRKLEARAGLAWSGWDRQRWLLGLSYSSTEVTDSYQDTNFIAERSPMSTTIRQEDEWGFAPIGTDRDLFSITLQDQWQITDTLELTGGLHFDDYSDIAQSTMPRIAAVWRPSDRHIFKVQYAEAFRPPTFSELYERTRTIRELSPETLSTSEVSYIYRDTRIRFEVTLFNSRLEDVIAYRVGAGTPFANTGSITLTGGELQLYRQLTTDWRLDANVSYTDARDGDTNERVPGSSAWLGNLILQGRIADGYLLALRWNAVGPRARWASDQRGDLDGYNLVDLTLTRTDLALPGLTARVGVSNLLDDDVDALAVERTYHHDLPQPGRSLWAQLRYDF